MFIHMFVSYDGCFTFVGGKIRSCEYKKIHESSSRVYIYVYIYRDMYLHSNFYYPSFLVVVLLNACIFLNVDAANEIELT